MRPLMDTRLKNLIREWEARLSPRTRSLMVDDTTLTLTRSIWWDESTPAFFQHDIETYWEALPRRNYGLVWDLGAASGMFTLSVCVRMPGARVVAFEPSVRQRVLLARNVIRNGFGSRVAIEPIAAWNRSENMDFRTHGAISALSASGEHLGDLPFNETVKAASLDDWVRARDGAKVDLVKMDIEGAEIEALEGMRETLMRHKPTLLVQSYHLRGGIRTYERCRDFLCQLGYQCREIGSNTGFLYADADC